jgi:hypothetical protein
MQVFSPAVLSAYAEDHGLWPWMNAKRITLRSLVGRRVCFGGFRRRTWRYHGLCPWGSIKKVISANLKIGFVIIIFLRMES